MIQQESCFLAHLRNWCAHQEVVYIIYIYTVYTSICLNMPKHNTKHVHTPSLRLTARSPNYIKVLPPITKKRTSECKVLKTTLSLSLHTFIHIIYICVYLFIYVYIFDIFIPSLMTPHPTIVLPLILPFTHLNTIISQAWEQAAVVLRGWFCINSTTPR